MHQQNRRSRLWRWGLPTLGFLLLSVSAGAAAIPFQNVTTTVLKAAVPSTGALFGSAVRISEDGKTVLVGAPSGAPCPGTGGSACGAVYVYGKSPAGWSLQATLTPADGGYPGFGFALALSPDATVAMVAGASATCPDSAAVPCGLLYVFARGAGGWTQEQRIVDPRLSDQYQSGISLTLSDGGATALVAGPTQSCALGTDCGAVQLLTRDGGSWTVRPLFLPPGRWVETITAALSRDSASALVGVPDSFCPFLPCAPALFLITDPAAVDASLISITPSSPAALPGLGFSIGLSGSGDVAVAGNPDLSAGLIFRRTGGTWIEERKLAVAKAASPGFGARAAISLDGGTAVFLAGNRRCSECVDLFVSQHLDGDWTDPIPLAVAVPGAAMPVSIQPLAIAGDGATVLLGTPWTSCAAGESCGSVQVFEGVSAAAVDMPALNGAGLALLALLLAVSGALLLRRRGLKPAR